jgi:hypothetical protein
MKSSYELAMERLNQTAPTVKISARAKEALAELDSKFAAKIAAREITLAAEIATATAAGDEEKAGELRQQLVLDRKKIQAELDTQKEEVREGKTKS